ncbi:cobalt/nickel transport system permease protein [Desulfobaculum xiamenense]|uniref:Cobalt/nickel transport system permease protein n=1 Tax=Desulfobaculum xiamenense TaxID=995050 RepID=A0A846QMN7_9BACT|nr:cobalt transporter CbiM [Desulfobaculum xiamenense]NJB69398.1 cobalt/nickel transport system permease protein [Desulfobaculum xiamenense]
MHISEGVLSTPVLLGGVVLAAVGTAVGLRRVDYDRLMHVAILSAVFFVASLIHVPIGPSSAHLVLNGLLGAMLGWAAFPAILIGLTLQAVLFQYGGLTALGANTFNMAAPAVVCFYLFRPLMISEATVRRNVGAFLCGAFAVLASGLLTAVSLGLSGDALIPAAQTLFIAHLPVAAVEGCVVSFVVSFLARAKPEALGVRPAH